MSMTNFPTRRQVETAAPLDMEQPRSEKPAQITIEVTPAGLVVKAEYTGTLSSIPLAIERLRQAGVIELVEKSAPAHLPAASAPASDQPPVCAVHGTPMKLMEKPDKGGRRWWCTKKVDGGFCKERA